MYYFTKIVQWFNLFQKYSKLLNSSETDWPFCTGDRHTDRQVTQNYFLIKNKYSSDKSTSIFDRSHHIIFFLLRVRVKVRSVPLKWVTCLAGIEGNVSTNRLSNLSSEIRSMGSRNATGRTWLSSEFILQFSPMEEGDQTLTEFYISKTITN